MLRREPTISFIRAHLNSNKASDENTKNKHKAAVSSFVLDFLIFSDIKLAVIVHIENIYLEMLFVDGFLEGSAYLNELL